MKYLIVTIIVVVSFSLSIAGCDKGDPVTNDNTNTQNNGNNNDTTSKKMKITVGSTVFTATLYDNTTATAFIALLPLTIDMSELNGNEKYYYFPGTLPTNPSNPRTIQTGDLMLYGNNCLVLFYQTFSTSYSYTRLARIENTSGLAAALGSGNVRATFELGSK